MSDHDECIKVVRKFHEGVIKGYLEKPNKKHDESISVLTDEELFLLSMLVLFDFVGEREMNNDLISRSALKKYKFTTQVCNGLEIEYVDVVCVATIDNAPTVEQSYQMPKDYLKNKLDYSRPQGEWIIDGHHYKCSRCGKTLAIMFSETDDTDLIGCPFCLADMRKEEENEGTRII